MKLRKSISIRSSRKVETLEVLILFDLLSRRVSNTKTTLDSSYNKYSSGATTGGTTKKERRQVSFQQATLFIGLLVDRISAIRRNTLTTSDEIQ